MSECERVRIAALALKAGNISLLGQMLNKSHASLRDNFEVTGRELDTLVETAQSQSCCIGSRMIGGGFGGCTVSLVKTNSVSEFKEIIYNTYFKATGRKVEFYDADVSDGIIIEKLD
ncbi:MAG: hypothetical protein ACI4MH_00655 [Candidatus Coproplasma sp.]